MGKNLGAKLFNFATPYKRIFIVFEIDNEQAFTLPGINTALAMVTSRDIVYFESVEEINGAVYLDLQLLEEKGNKFADDFLSFKEFVKKRIFTTNKGLSFQVVNRILLSENLVLKCKLIEENERT